MKSGNPQLEDGYTRIANEILEALISYRLSGEEMKCLLMIIRMTYGYQKITNEISIKDFSIYTDMVKPSVVRALRKLQEKNIIIVNKNANRSKLSYRLNKIYSTWKPLTKKLTHKPKSSIIRECYICGYSKAVHLHHIVPVIEGGSNSIKNKIPLCPNHHALADRKEYKKDYLLTLKLTKESVNKKVNHSVNKKVNASIKDNIKENNNIYSEEIVDKKANKKIKTNEFKKKKAIAVLRYFNKIKNSRYTDYRDILARINQGATVIDCKYVIDLKNEDKWFKENQKYFRPQTLFNKKNFDSYINEKPEKTGWEALDEWAKQED